MSRSKKFPVMVRQGDVLLVAVAGGLLNAKTKRRDNGKVVLAYGEVTGHSHAIAEKTTKLTVLDDAHAMAEAARQLLAEVGLTTEIRDEDVVGVLEVPAPAELVHEEHGTIALDAPNYVVLRQREYSPEEIRSVAD